MRRRVRRHDVDSDVAQRLLGSLVRAESSRPSYDARVRAVLKEASQVCRASWTMVSQAERLEQRQVSFDEPPRRRSSVSVQDATKVAATAVEVARYSPARER